jgi:hypothetical protein
VCSVLLYCFVYVSLCTGHTQKNGAVSRLFTLSAAPFVCVCPVYYKTLTWFQALLCCVYIAV